MLVTVGEGRRKNGKNGITVDCGRATVAVDVVNYGDDDIGYEGRVAVVRAFVGMEINLLKRRSSYIDNETGERKFATRFYGVFGTEWIGLETTFIPNEEGKDPDYGKNKRILSAFADVLPPKDDEGTPTESAKPVAEGKNPTLQAMDDGSDIPF